MNIKPPIKYGFYTYLVVGSLLMISLFFIGFTMLIIVGNLWIAWPLPAVCLIVLLWLWYRGGGKQLFTRKSTND